MLAVQEGVIMKTKLLALLTAAIVFATGTGAAQANLLTNGGFDISTGFVAGGCGSDPGCMLLAPGSTTMTGWTVNGSTSGDGVAWIGPGNPYNIVAQSGSYSLDLTGYNNGAPYNGVQQSVVTAAANGYQLQFYLGTDINESAGTYSIHACGGSTCQTFSVTTGAPVGGTPVNAWTLETLDFTATGASTLISLLGTDSGGRQDYIGLDTVSLIQTSVGATPLPAALPLLATGLASIGLFGWRKKRKNAALAA
jgi:hypothetical protein